MADIVHVFFPELVPFTFCPSISLVTLSALLGFVLQILPLPVHTLPAKQPEEHGGPARKL